jgi:hypothetical protein
MNTTAQCAMYASQNGAQAFRFDSVTRSCGVYTSRRPGSLSSSLTGETGTLESCSDPPPACRQVSGADGSGQNCIYDVQCNATFAGEPDAGGTSNSTADCATYASQNGAQAFRFDKVSMACGLYYDAPDFAVGSSTGEAGTLVRCEAPPPVCRQVSGSSNSGQNCVFDVSCNATFSAIPDFGTTSNSTADCATFASQRGAQAFRFDKVSMACGIYTSTDPGSATGSTTGETGTLVRCEAPPPVCRQVSGTGSSGQTCIYDVRCNATYAATPDLGTTSNSTADCATFASRSGAQAYRFDTVSKACGVYISTDSGFATGSLTGEAGTLVRCQDPPPVCRQVSGTANGQTCTYDVRCNATYAVDSRGVTRNSTADCATYATENGAQAFKFDTVSQACGIYRNSNTPGSVSASLTGEVGSLVRCEAAIPSVCSQVTGVGGPRTCVYNVQCNATVSAVPDEGFTTNSTSSCADYASLRGARAFRFDRQLSSCAIYTTTAPGPSSQSSRQVGLLQGCQITPPCRQVSGFSNGQACIYDVQCNSTFAAPPSQGVSKNSTSDCASFATQNNAIAFDYNTQRSSCSIYRSDNAPGRLSSSLTGETATLNRCQAGNDPGPVCRRNTGTSAGRTCTYNVQCNATLSAIPDLGTSSNMTANNTAGCASFATANGARAYRFVTTTGACSLYTTTDPGPATNFANGEVGRLDSCTPPLTTTEENPDCAAVAGRNFILQTENGTPARFENLGESAMLSVTEGTTTGSNLIIDSTCRLTNEEGRVASFSSEGSGGGSITFISRQLDKRQNNSPICVCGVTNTGRLTCRCNGFSIFGLNLSRFLGIYRQTDTFTPVQFRPIITQASPTTTTTIAATTLTTTTVAVTITTLSTSATATASALPPPPVCGQLTATSDGGERTCIYNIRCNATYAAQPDGGSNFINNTQQCAEFAAFNSAQAFRYDLPTRACAVYTLNPPGTAGAAGQTQVGEVQSCSPPLPGAATTTTAAPVSTTTAAAAPPPPVCRQVSTDNSAGQTCTFDIRCNATYTETPNLGTSLNTTIQCARYAADNNGRAFQFDAPNRVCRLYTTDPLPSARSAGDSEVGILQGCTSPSRAVAAKKSANLLLRQSDPEQSPPDAESEMDSESELDADGTPPPAPELKGRTLVPADYGECLHPFITAHSVDLRLIFHRRRVSRLETMRLNKDGD